MEANRDKERRQLEAWAKSLRDHPYAGDPGECDMVSDMLAALDAEDDSA